KLASMTATYSSNTTQILLLPAKIVKSVSFGLIAEYRKKTPGATSRTSPNSIFGNSSAAFVGMAEMSRQASGRSQLRAVAFMSALRWNESFIIESDAEPLYAG